MNYNKIPDGQFCVLVAESLKPKYQARINHFNANGAELVWDWFGREQTTGFFPLTRPEDSFSAIKKNRIGISPEGKTTWKAFHESGICATHRNPLRAALTVLLMLNDGDSRQQPEKRRGGF